jgi:hypothetical protein
MTRWNTAVMHRHAAKFCNHELLFDVLELEPCAFLVIRSRQDYLRWTSINDSLTTEDNYHYRKIWIAFACMSY